MPFLDAHRRRIPAQTVAHSCALGMDAQSALARDKAYLAFVSFSVDGSAVRRVLRGYGRIDPEKLSSAGTDLEGKDDLEAEPALIKNPLVQSDFLPNHPPCIFDPRLGRRGHGVDFQSFLSPPAEVVGDIRRRFVMPALAHTGCTGGQMGPRIRHAAIDTGRRPDIGRDDGHDLAGKACMRGKPIERDGDFIGCVVQDRLAAISPCGDKTAETADIGQKWPVVHALHAQFRLVTNYCRDAPSQHAIGELTRIFANILRGFEPGLIGYSRECSPVHALIINRTKITASKLVNSLKGGVVSCIGTPGTMIAEYAKSQADTPAGRVRLPPRPEGSGIL